MAPLKQPFVSVLSINLDVQNGFFNDNILNVLFKCFEGRMEISKCGAEHLGEK